MKKHCFVSRLIMVTYLLHSVCQRPGYIGCDDSGIPSKKNVLFQRADKRSKFTRNYISFRSLPKQARQNKNEKKIL